MVKEDHTSVYFDREKLSFVGLKESNLKQLKETFNTIDIDAELKKMALWLQTSKGKKRKGNIGFILNWLNNASPPHKCPTIADPIDPVEYDLNMRPLLLDYLQDLWKGREHILEFNKARKKS